MKTYFVIATVWSEEHKKQIKVIAGQFTKFMNALIFCDAYNAFYHANATIEEDLALLNN